MAIDLDAPDHIIGTAAQVVADVAAGYFFKGGVIEPMQPLVGHKTQQQITHQFGGRKQQAVRGIIVLVGHARNFSQRRRDNRATVSKEHRQMSIEDSARAINRLASLAAMPPGLKIKISLSPGHEIYEKNASSPYGISADSYQK